MNSKLTQAEIALVLGVDQSTISNYERNTKKPEFETFLKIADFFNVSLDYLVGRTSEEKSFYQKYYDLKNFVSTELNDLISKIEEC
ncbi:helix-turn-helix transcriptional regulator [Robertmurraya korlensis]|nr:helix-turn-helix transcriptional regulator [Robertmurraya korlensis]